MRLPTLAVLLSTCTLLLPSIQSFTLPNGVPHNRRDLYLPEGAVSSDVNNLRLARREPQFTRPPVPPINIDFSDIPRSAHSRLGRLGRIPANFNTNRRQTLVPNPRFGRSDGSRSPVKPKVLIVQFFGLETTAFLQNYTPSLLALRITLPGLSPRYPEVFCTANGDVCLVTTGEGEINAAATITALLYSGWFDLRKTYWLTGGVAGMNPEYGTTGSVTFPRFAVQLALQYEVDSRQLPGGGGGWRYGYLGLGTTALETGVYPGWIYGTEVFALNDRLRRRAADAARRAQLYDTPEAAAYRVRYPSGPARDPPGVVLCDTGTADTFWTGSALAEGFGNFTLLMTNGTGRYCTTQQEDNAILSALIRSTAAKLTDFSRIIVLRTGSDFDRAPPGVDELYHLLQAPQAGFPPALANVYLAGVEVVKEIVSQWDRLYDYGVTPTNYIGDILNTLQNPYGFRPDIGVGYQYVPQSQYQAPLPRT